MQISLNIILEALQSFRLETYVPNDAALAFTKCLPLPDDGEPLAEDCIYVGGLSKAIINRTANASFYCICLRDRIKDELETADALSGFIIVNENITTTMLFTRVQNRFFSVLEWVHRMNETLIGGGTMQDVFDLCEDIIDNHISVSDSSFMLLAQTRHIHCDDPICVALDKYGYHPEETMQKFRKYDLFKTWETADPHVYIDESCKVAKYVTLHRIFKFGNQYFAHVVMSCNRHPWTASMKDLFQIFTDILAIFIERSWEAKNAFNHAYDTFVTDLIEGAIASKSIIEERAHIVGIPLSGPFCLLQIVASESPTISLGKMMFEFAELFPRIRFIRYQQRIIAINQFFSRDIDQQLELLASHLEVFLKKYDAQCGISPVYNELDETRYAFRQTSLSLKYAHLPADSRLGRHTHPGSAEQNRIHFFEEKYIFCLLGENDENAVLWYHSDGHRLLKKLHQYDKRQKSNNIQLLYEFLSNERNATLAANELNMHRNNVTYHINRIQELLEIDLNDRYHRFLLMVSFYLLELYGFAD